MNVPTPPQPQAKKGLGPLAWILIGCGGLILIGGIVLFLGVFFLTKEVAEVVEEGNPTKTMAEMVVKLNPDLELIESDDETVTFRDKNGDVMTMNFEDIQKGRFSMTGADGETSNITFGPEGISGTGTGGEGEETEFSMFGGADASNVPDEVKFPAAEDLGATMTQSSDRQSSGMINFVTDAPVDEVIEWQSESFGDCEVNRMDFAGRQVANLECGKNTATLQFHPENGGWRVITTYTMRR